MAKAICSTLSREGWRVPFEDLVAEGLVEVGHTHHLGTFETLGGEELAEIVGKASLGGFLLVQKFVDAGGVQQPVEFVFGQGFAHLSLQSAGGLCYIE